MDANILYSRTIRDWLFALSTSKIQMFDLFSSEDVFAEVVYHYRRSNPKRSGDEVNGLVNQIRELVHVVDHYDCERAQADYMGADPNDLHLHAAAVDNDCSVLLTNDRKLYASLDESQLDGLPYSVCTADDFSVIWLSRRQYCWTKLLLVSCSIGLKMSRRSSRFCRPIDPCRMPTFRLFG